MEHKNCVHGLLATLAEHNRANPGTPEQESHAEQLSGHMMTTMRELAHGETSPAYIEGALIGGRILLERVLGLVEIGEFNADWGHLMQHLVGEMGLVLSRVYNSGAGTVAELEELWNL